ncbi:MAG: phosphodiester glycosidase family protein [Phormidesmis sp.]
MPLDKRSHSKTNRYKLYLLLAIATLACISAWRLVMPFANAEPERTTLTAAHFAQVSAQMFAQTAAPNYRTYELPQATAHVVTLPAGTRLSIAVADELTTVETFAQQQNALAVINGGFFDPQNGKTTSHIIIQGQTVGNPAANERLMENPDLSPYINQILNRSEFRVYQCRTSAQTSKMRYEIAVHNALDTALPGSCMLVSLLGAGPQLLPQDTSAIEAFTDYENGEIIRDAIGSRQPNARSAIALTSDGSILLIMVAQRLDAPGMTLAEVTELAASLGAVQLLNLDGGSSSALYYNGQTYLGRLEANGDPIERPVKSVILIGQ